MRKLLRRISPRRPAAVQHTSPLDDNRSTSAHSAQHGQAILRFDPAAEHAKKSQTTTSPAAGRGSAARSEPIEERVLADAQECLAIVRSGNSVSGHSSARHSAARSQAEQNDSRPQQTPGSKVRASDKVLQPTRAPSRTGTARVQLRLSKATVQILQAFRKAGKHPSAIVEKALWRDAAIRDAAAILLVERSSE